MTNEAQSTSPKIAAPVAAPLKSNVDIRRVISGSTSDVPLAELSRKGFTQVKVLNQAVITKLIIEAVDEVLASRTQKFNQEERQKLVTESQAKFGALAREQVQREKGRTSELEKANEALLQENEKLSGEVAELKRALLVKGEEIAQLKSAPPPAVASGLSDQVLQDLMKRVGSAGAANGSGGLEATIQKLAEKIDRLQYSGGTGSAPGVYDKDVVVDFLLRDEVFKGAESNIDKIKVKEEKAGGVKDTLAKLKALQKGG